MRTDCLVYISGPITAYDQFSIEDNVSAALAVHLRLTNAGLPSFCPHLSGGYPSAYSQVPYTTWIDLDYAIIDRCTHMLMLPRWEASKGAKLERQYAMTKVIPIFYDEATLLAAVKGEA